MNPPSASRLRAVLTGVAMAVVFTFGPMGGAWAQADGARSDKAKADKKKGHDDAKTKDAKAGKESGKAASIGTFGDWGVYETQGKAKTCYALAQPKNREPGKVKRDAAYIFISYRPAENVKNEISIIMGFAMKDGGEAQATIGDDEFGLISKGSNAWIKNPAEEGHFIEAMKKGSKLVVKAASTKGKVTTDTYPLAGLSQALDKARKQCQ
ncbi:invasion associated locus B family protein [uncultured Rhodoblastus sp.]|uniref:invasion associated locus B family protein n=1 Tax=uncultured Rhodoblastus sp. TaxID=543037 RepID=UPI0025D9DC65|nr:invasion associated locus B family protein [uncultured Rhodoblastus sp.]